MKKLMLVTLLAVSASWILSEVRYPGLVTEPTRPEVYTPRKIALPEPPATPPAKHLPLGRQVDAARQKLKLAQDRGGAKTGPTRPKGWVAPPTISMPAANPNPMPVWFPKTEADQDSLSRPDASGFRVLVSLLAPSEKDARQNLREKLEREVTQWVVGDVPTSWKVPGPLIDAMVHGKYVQTVPFSLRPLAGVAASEAASSTSPDLSGLEDIQTLYRAGQKVEFSPRNRTRIVEAYRRDLASLRMQRLGGGLALALACLAVLSSYIKTDEATKGYYTNRLRLVAAAGLGIAGVVGYRILG